MGSFSVIVSCYKPHLQKLLRLLESLQAQTLLPLEVIVSSSSTRQEDLPVYPQYGFELKVLTFEERRNAAQNRNTAAAHARGDYLTFIDADDVCHPQRLAAIHAALEGGAELVLHNYFLKSELNDPFPVYNRFEVEYDCLRPAPSGCVVHTANRPFHHSMSTVHCSVFGKVQFPEGADYERREDAVFCNRVVQLGVRAAAIHNRLAKYDEAGSWETV